MIQFIHGAWTKWKWEQTCISERAIGIVKDKLDGKDPYNPQANFPEVGAQVEYLLNKATDDANLSKMFVGWSPWC